MSSTRRPERSQREERPKKQKMIVRPTRVNLSNLSTQKASTEHDRQNSSKRAPGPMGSLEGGRPPGPWGSTVREIYQEGAKGVLVEGNSRLIGEFLKLAFEHQPEVRWVAPDAPSAVAWVRQRQEIHRNGAYLAGKGVSEAVAPGADDPVPLSVTVRFEDQELNTLATIEGRDLGEDMEKAARREQKRQARGLTEEQERQRAEEKAGKEKDKAAAKAEPYPGTTEREVQAFLWAVLDTIDTLLQEGAVDDSELSKLMEG